MSPLGQRHSHSFIQQISNVIGHLPPVPPPFRGLGSNLVISEQLETPAGLFNFALHEKKSRKFKLQTGAS